MVFDINDTIFFQLFTSDQLLMLTQPSIIVHILYGTEEEDKKSVTKKTEPAVETEEETVA